MNATVFERLNRWLDQRGAAFDVVHHSPVYTSAEAAAVRGTSLASGAKALICKAGGQFVMLVLPADRKLDARPLRSRFGWKNLRFATREEVASLTGLAPGAIPPFGSLFGLPSYCDERLVEQPRINFNAGDHSISISMSIDDYLRAEQPERASFSQESS